MTFSKMHQSSRHKLIITCYTCIQTWRLCCDNKALDMMDPTLLESCEKSKVIKCINIGLHCVQEDPNDRPSMSTVVIMLGSESRPLPFPTQPAFVVRRRFSATSSSSASANQIPSLSTSSPFPWRKRDDDQSCSCIRDHRVRNNDVHNMNQ